MIHVEASFLIPSLARGSRQGAMLSTWLREGRDLGISAIGWAEFPCDPLGAETVDLAGSIAAEPLLAPAVALLPFRTLRERRASH